MYVEWYTNSKSVRIHLVDFVNTPELPMMLTRCTALLANCNEQQYTIE